MNFNKRHNVFGDIPGFDASKGERIVKALQRLWEKIEYLEQIRNIERNSKSKEELSSSIDEDPTIADVRYKLLILQLQYVRSVLRRKGGRVGEEPKTASQQTQTGSSLIGDYSPPSKDVRVSDAEGLPRNTTKTVEPPFHYHLKLDDVPFILGASSGASHSVVANMQNLIALMKSHNKTLCGGPPTRTTHPDTSSEKFARELTRDLRQLSTKQKTLANALDSVEIGQKQASGQRRKVDVVRCRSNSESCAHPANERKATAPPANQRAGRLMTNPPSTAGRRHFLRSLQNCKSALTMKDISWD